jgi:hypothetical protein
MKLLEKKRKRKRKRKRNKEKDELMEVCRQLNSFWLGNRAGYLN